METLRPVPAPEDGHTHLGVRAIVLEAVLQQALVLLHHVVPALLRGRRGALVAGGDGGSRGGVRVRRQGGRHL